MWATVKDGSDCDIIETDHDLEMIDVQAKPSMKDGVRVGTEPTIRSCELIVTFQ